MQRKDRKSNAGQMRKIFFNCFNFKNKYVTSSLVRNKMLR